jgi:hypothetical protein
VVYSSRRPGAGDCGYDKDRRLNEDGSSQAEGSGEKRKKTEAKEGKEEMNITDKEVIVIAITLIGLYALYVMGVKAENIVTAIVSGLCGIAVGQRIGKKTDAI